MRLLDRLSNKTFSPESTIEFENRCVFGDTSYPVSSSADAPDLRRDKGQPAGTPGGGRTGALPALAQAGGRQAGAAGVACDPALGSYRIIARSRQDSTLGGI